MALVKIKDVSINDLVEINKVNLFNYTIEDRYSKNPTLAYDSADYDICIAVVATLSAETIKHIAIFIYNQLKNRKKNKIEIDKKTMNVDPVTIENITNMLKEIREKDKNNKFN